jgi:phage-related protein (TIGR01555 family)
MQNASQQRSTENLFLDTMVSHGDGWQNLMTRAGVLGQDKRISTAFTANTLLSYTELSALYRDDGIAKRIVDIPVSDMIRKWLYIEGDSDNSVVKALDKIGTRKAVKDAKKWARLYGGSLLLLGIDDGQKGDKVLETPLRENSIKSLEFFRIYPKEQITWETSDLDDDPSVANYGKPKLYTIHPVLEQASTQFKVHYTRVIRFEGEALPQRESAQVRWWGDSILQSVFSRLRGFANSLIATESILDEFIIGILTIENLQDLIAGGKEDLITARLQQIDLSKHILNTMLVDKEEDFTRIAARVNGIKDILEFFKDVISAVAGIPQLKLFGEQSKGLGSQAAGNIRMYYDDIAEKQEDELRLPLERIVSLLLKSRNFKEKGLDTWHLKFNPLWELSEKEIAESRHLIAKADSEYVKNGVLTAEEVAVSRFGGETYSTDTVLVEKDAVKRKKASDENKKLNQKPVKNGPKSKDKPLET